MLQQMPYNLINGHFTQGKPWVTDTEASAHLIGVIEEKMNQSCALFEITFSYQAWSESAQYMFKPGSGQTAHTVDLRAAIQKAAAVFPIRQPAQKAV